MKGEGDACCWNQDMLSYSPILGNKPMSKDASKTDQKIQSRIPFKVQTKEGETSKNKKRLFEDVETSPSMPDNEEKRGRWTAEDMEMFQNVLMHL